MLALRYKKINLELIVLAEDADAVIAELNTVLDGMDERHTLFGGDIETVAVEHSGKAKRSALAHTMAARETAIKATRKGLTAALRAVI